MCGNMIFIAVTSDPTFCRYFDKKKIKLACVICDVGFGLFCGHRCAVYGVGFTVFEYRIP